MIKTIVFDFDGVLVDSNRLKRDAWFALFPESEKISHAHIEEVLSRIAQTRYDILHEIHRVSGKPSYEAEHFVDEYAKRYNDYVQQAVATDGLVPGVKETLEKLSSSYHFYINSATPQDALCETVSNLGIKNYFRNILGRPATKEENLEKILAQEHSIASEMVMVGDGESDWEAARIIGCPFIGIANEGNQWEQREFPLLQDFRLLPEVVKQFV